jgi:hypothetical protein
MQEKLSPSVARLAVQIFSRVIPPELLDDDEVLDMVGDAARDIERHLAVEAAVKGVTQALLARGIDINGRKLMGAN